ncbi:hypothetical protein M0R45_017480 [Rubus argutus]|uniref:BZIP domain-containing protein n=1 Tax=Rubus argutus TaxID=59490 RepID=A0AAW1XW07_RUBAR
MKGSSRPPLPPSPSPLHLSSNSERSNPTDRELGAVIPENTETQSEDVPAEVAVPESESARRSRMNAQRFRLRQFQRSLRLESQFTAIEAEIAVTATRVASARRAFALLREENISIRKSLSNRTRELKHKEAEQVALEEERDSLLQLHEEQNKEREAVAAADIPPMVGSG